MITRADITERVSEWQLTGEVAEKDHVLGWLLWGLGSAPVLGDQRVFKGGTCLKKCYIETDPPFLPRSLRRSPHIMQMRAGCQGCGRA
jgi:hypothetical protein